MGQLRKGFTTGTCASAAAKAAALFLLHNTLLPSLEGSPAPLSTVSPASSLAVSPVPSPAVSPAAPLLPSPVEIPLPGGAVSFLNPVPQDPSGDLAGYWGVQKDAGDDPDVTGGAWICAAVVQVDPKEFARLCREGQGYFHKDFPGLYLNGGRGIGMVTKQGLACPPGHYAINPVPRTMIFSAVRQVVDGHGDLGCLEIRLAVPGGEGLGERTFNPRLGIVGGISILGTTGIVEPMSQEALLETIRLDIRTRLLENSREQAGMLLMAPGNYGSTWLKTALGVPEDRIVRCSNFVKAAMEMAAEEGGRHLLFTGHLGKLVKVAGGVENTHSRYGDRRMEILGDLVRGCGELPDTDRERLLHRIGHANTTDEAVGILEEYGLAEQVLTLGAAQAKTWLEHWGAGHLKVEVVLFSGASRTVGRTKGARALLEKWRRGDAG